MKKFNIILLVVLAIIAIIVGVIYFIDTPVVEEGQEPTVAQKIIIVAKEKLNLILSALGVSAVGVIAFCFRKVVTSSANTSAVGAATLKKMDEFAEDLKTKNQQLEQKYCELLSALTVLREKLDIQSSVTFDTYLLSDLPKTVRENINKAKADYANVSEQRAAVENLVDNARTSVVDVKDGLAEGDDADSTKDVLSRF